MFYSVARNSCSKLTISFFCKLTKYIYLKKYIEHNLYKLKTRRPVHSHELAKSQFLKIS